MSTTTHEEIRIGALAIRFLVKSDASGGTVTVFEFDVPAGGRVPIAHSHDAYEETIYGLRGVMTFTIEGTPFELGPGDAVCIRRGAVHRFDNHGDADATARRSSARVFWGRTTSGTSPQSCKPRPAALPIPPSSPP